MNHKRRPEETFNYTKRKTANSEMFCNIVFFFFFFLRKIQNLVNVRDNSNDENVSQKYLLFQLFLSVVQNRMNLNKIHFYSNAAKFCWRYLKKKTKIPLRS